MGVELETFFKEAQHIHAPDEAYRVRCPNCYTVLSEYLFGVLRAMCRICKWRGVIVRSSPSLIQSVTTIYAGKPWKSMEQRVVTPSKE